MAAFIHDWFCSVLRSAAACLYFEILSPDGAFVSAINLRQPSYDTLRAAFTNELSLTLLDIDAATTGILRFSTLVTGQLALSIRVTEEDLGAFEFAIAAGLSQQLQGKLMNMLHCRKNSLL